MTTLSIVRAAGSTDSLASAYAVLSRSSGDLRWRLAYHPDDLVHAHWRNIEYGVLAKAVPFSLPGTQLPSGARIYAEVERAGGNVVVSTAAAQAGGTPNFPTQTINPQPGFYIRARCDLDPVYPVHHYNDGPGIDRPPGSGKYPQGNNLMPLVWHSDGYGWITDKTWEIDIGETPPDLILARLTVNQFAGGLNFFSIGASNQIIYADIAGNGLNLQGGVFNFAVVCTFVDGKRGRYHLARALTVGAAPAFARSQWFVPSGSNPDWDISFAADGVPFSQMPPGPDVSRVTEIDIVLKGFGALPSGQLRIKEMGILSV